MWRAAGRLGIAPQAARPAVEAGLAEFGARVRFRHPLVRSAAYRSASAPDRQAAHRALAEATDPAADPDRRAWHRAQAAAGPGRGGRGRAGAVGGPGAGPRRAGRGRGVPGALGAADRRPGAPRRAHAGGGAGQPAGRRVRHGAASCWPTAEAGPLDELAGAPGWTCCAGRSRSPRAWAATLRRCCSRRPGGSSRSTSTWPARPT